VEKPLALTVPYSANFELIPVINNRLTTGLTVLWQAEWFGVYNTQVSSRQGRVPSLRSAVDMQKAESAMTYQLSQLLALILDKQRFALRVAVQMETRHVLGVMP
jgi:hypothetical protein